MEEEDASGCDSFARKPSVPVSFKVEARDRSGEEEDGEEEEDTDRWRGRGCISRGKAPDIGNGCEEKKA